VVPDFPDDPFIPDNCNALAAMPGQWVDRIRQHRPTDKLILDMGSSASPTYGQQEGTAYNGPLGCDCYHPLFLFNQDGLAGHAGQDRLQLVSCARYVTLQLAGVAVPRRLCRAILDRIRRFVNIPRGPRRYDRVQEETT
jgi:hypothetical protein